MIYFGLLVFSVVSITLIHQEITSLAIRNHSFRHPIEGRLTVRYTSPVVIRTKRVHLLQSTVHRILTHWRNRKRSLFRKDRRSIFLTTANTEGMCR